MDGSPGIATDESSISIGASGFKKPDSRAAWVSLAVVYPSMVIQQSRQRPMTQKSSTPARPIFSRRPTMLIIPLR